MASSFALRSCRLQCLLCFALLFLLTCRAEAFRSDAPLPATLEQRIAHEVELIRAGERTGLKSLGLGRLWAHLASDYADAAEFVKAEAAYNRALQLFQADPAGRNDYATALDNLGSVYMASGNFDEAERCRKQALAARETIGDGLEIARSKGHLAEISLARHRFGDAQREASDAYDAMVALKDPDASDRIATLITMVYSSCMLRECANGLDRAREAKLLALAAFPPDSLPVGEARMALGYAEWKAGIKDGPDEEMREGIRIMKLWMTPGHPYVLGVMEQYHKYLNETHRKAEAKEVAKEEKTMKATQPNTVPIAP